MAQREKQLWDGTFIRLAETDKALLISDTGEKVRGKWVPKSQVEVHVPDATKDNLIEVTMPLWLAEDKGFV